MSAPHEAPAATAAPCEDPVPLCVDLDGTLIASDLLWESLCAMIRANPLDVARVPLWLLSGKARLKREVARRGPVDAETLPYRPEVVAFAAAQKEAGRPVVLVTAADERPAAAVADHLGLFDEVIASDGDRNLKGPAKGEALERRFGRGGFDYIGDSRADLPVWRAARRGYAASASRALLREAGRDRPLEEVVARAGVRPRAVLKALRPHQWAKNLLLFVPLLTSHQFLDPPRLLGGMIAFVAFSLSASAVYILNDLLDLKADRRHRSKRNRPFASGAVPIPLGAALAAVLLVAALGIALLLPPAFVGLLLLYILTTTAYSLYLKRKLMVDVVCLAGLYSLRILAGGAADGIRLSAWLLAFSMFLFLSLAFAKRYTELDFVRDGSSELVGRGYRPSDLELIRTMGPCCGLLCVLVLCLYINSPDVLRLYRRPEGLWLSCPLLLYWICRVWFLACRKELADDPVLFAVRDKISYAVGVILLLILAASL